MYIYAFAQLNAWCAVKDVGNWYVIDVVRAHLRMTIIQTQKSTDRQSRVNFNKFRQLAKSHAGIWICGSSICILYVHIYYTIICIFDNCYDNSLECSTIINYV